MPAAGADNTNANPDNIISTIKDTKIYVPVVTLPASDNQKLSTRLSKGSERSFYWNEYKAKSENKDITNEYRYFLESNFVGVNRLFVLFYINYGDNAKRFNAQKYYLPKCIINNHNVTINGKILYDQPIDSDIKRYEEIRKLTTGQSENYTTGCLLHYDFIKNHYRFIAVDLSRQKELNADPKTMQQVEFIG